MNRKILALAIPNIVSNVTVPLLGMVDLGIVGRLGDDALIGGIAVGGTLFNFLYWNFSFLRMGTSGLTAQAYGARDFREAARVLVRALCVAGTVALLLWALQQPILHGAMYVMEGSEAVEQAARRYFLVRIWAAPATLALYALTGWFIGMQNARAPMWIAIGINLVNIGASLAAVRLGGMGIEGVALGTVVAQWSGVLAALFVIRRYYGRFFDRSLVRQSGMLKWNVMRRFFRVNRDIFLRTVCLVAVFTYFTVASTRMGDTLLAVNTLLLQLFTLFSYLMDGFAYAGEALAGRYYGARNLSQLRRAIRGLLGWGTGVMLLFTLLYATVDTGPFYRQSGYPCSRPGVCRMGRVRARVRIPGLYSGRRAGRDDRDLGDAQRHVRSHRRLFRSLFPAGIPDGECRVVDRLSELSFSSRRASRGFLQSPNF